MSTSTEPTYAVVDCETTIKCSVGENKASPFHPDNSIVLRGVRLGKWAASTKPLVQSDPVGPNEWVDHNVTLLVGHHVGFDIHHLRKSGELSDEFLGTVGLWDTQLAEYLLTAQRTTYAALDDLSAAYGGTAKDSRVTTMFEAGMGADSVPMEMLQPYLAADIDNTQLVFVKQFQEAQKQQLVPLITTQMDALASTIEMTYNGLKVDTDALLVGATMCRTRVEFLKKKFNALVAVSGHPLPTDPSSPKQLSLLFFGGEYGDTEKVACGTYKNGNARYRMQLVKRKVKGLGFAASGPLNGNGCYSTDDKVLHALKVHAPTGSSTSAEILDALIELREKSKQLSTYWEGLLKLVMPDGFIHHDLNHCVTRTGRLSSSHPNMQNITNGDIKKVFVSRWGNDGHIVEADYSQLEMVELAILSGDNQLLADIRDGVDMHDTLFKELHGRLPSKAERKANKQCAFALVYGAGANGVAEQGGISKAQAQKFIETFYARYKGVEDYHKRLIVAAQLGRRYTGLKDAETGLPVGEFTYVSKHTKRRYWFREYPTDWGTINFSPTELKNYMVQGGATGDKVPMICGILYRVLKNHPRLKDKCLMVNTVHDSIMFDIHKDVVYEAFGVIKETMESAPEHYARIFGYSLPLPLKVGLSYGPNWLDQSEVEFDEHQKLWRKAA